MSDMGAKRELALLCTPLLCIPDTLRGRLTGCLWGLSICRWECCMLVAAVV